jgi:hypothetical protein
MSTVRALTIASLAIILHAHVLTAQSLRQYREFALESNIASIVETSGARHTDVRTLHERPVKIQELEWHAPYVPAGKALADPVQDMLFSFCDDKLYRIVVTYDRDRMDGLTSADLIEAVSGAFGSLPMQARAADSPPLGMPSDTMLVARWDDGASVLSLVRGGYSREFQLVLISKELSARARSAAKESLRLDAREAPQSGLDERRKEVADAAAVREKVRIVNKTAFRP